MIRHLDLLSIDSAAITVEAWVKSSAHGRYRYVVAKGVHACEAAS
ncbi:MAG: hypothetical protein ACLQVF_15395 [Isosphaeraceae bacterium]